MSDLKMSEGIEVSEMLKNIDKHDQQILDLLMRDRNELTKIQISKILKRSRSDVGYSLRRLKSGSHINQESRYGRWYAVNYDYESEVASKRPDEAAGKIKSMEQEIAQLKDDNAELVEMLKRQMTGNINLVELKLLPSKCYERDATRLADDTFALLQKHKDSK